MKRLLPFLFVMLLFSCNSITKKAIKTSIETLTEQSRISGVEFGEPQVVFEDESVCQLKINAINGSESTDIVYTMMSEAGVTYETFWDISERGNVDLPATNEKEDVEKFKKNIALHFPPNLRVVGSKDKMLSVNFLGSTGNWQKGEVGQIEDLIDKPYIYTTCEGVCESDRYGNYNVTCKLIVFSNGITCYRVYRNNRLLSDYYASTIELNAAGKTEKFYINSMFDSYYICNDDYEFLDAEELFGNEDTVTLTSKQGEGKFTFILIPYGFQNALKSIQ